MKIKALSLLLAALTLLTGCVYAVSQTQPGEDDYLFYYVAADLESAAGGDAIGSELTALPGLAELETADAVTLLMETLLEGPRSETLKTPFPSGTTLSSVALDGRHVTVDMSFAYSALSGVSLTMADYCITLTLTQLTQIDTISVTVRGQELAYRDSQSFSDLDLLLTSGEDVVSTVPVQLWFLGENGALTAVLHRLELYEGDTQISALVDAMERGPTERGLVSALPEGFTVISARLEDDVCYVNLSAVALQDMLPDADLETALDALARSLSSLDTVAQVRYLVDGEFAIKYGGVPVAGTYPREG